MKPEDIKIPSLPDPTTWDAGAGGRAVPMLYIGGHWYSLQIAADQNTDLKVVTAAQMLIYQKMQTLEATALQLARHAERLRLLEQQLKSAVELPVPTKAIAATGLKIYKEDDEGPGIYGVEKPLQFFPQRITRVKTLDADASISHKILPGQFRPKIVMGYIQWNVASKEILTHNLYDLQTGKQFIHYHAVERDHDCSYTLPRRAASYEDLLKIYSMWEQELQIVNIASIAVRQPDGMPHCDSIKVEDVVIKEAGTWSL